MSCGTKVELVRPAKCIFKTSEVFSIADIQKPADSNSIEQKYHMMFAFPVLLQNKLFYFHHEPENIMHKELLPVVMNSFYIDTENH